MSSPEQPCTVTDPDGRPWMFQPNDSRDIARCIVCALKSAAAFGEAFNGARRNRSRGPMARNC